MINKSQNSVWSTVWKSSADGWEAFQRHMVCSLNRWSFLSKTPGFDAAAARRFPFRHETKKKRENGAEELQTQAKYLSVRKVNWWPSISLLSSEPVNRRAAITHVLTACNGIFLGWAKGCQTVRCRSQKQLGGLKSNSKCGEQRKTTSNTPYWKASDISINYTKAAWRRR